MKRQFHNGEIAPFARSPKTTFDQSLASVNPPKTLLIFLQGFPWLLFSFWFLNNYKYIKTSLSSNSSLLGQGETAAMLRE